MAVDHIPSPEAPPSPRLVFSMGDPNGIGPEVVLKALADPRLRGQIRPAIAGSIGTLRAHAERIQANSDNAGLALPRLISAYETDVRERLAAPPDANAPVPVLELRPGSVRLPDFGATTAEGGAVAMEAVAAGIDLCQRGEADALVTAPISKEAIAMAGYAVPGHTEFLAERTGTDAVLMILCTERDALAHQPLRVALVTAHVPVADITRRLTDDLVRAKLRLFADSLRRDFGVARPTIAVFGLNPHAGDGGVLGREEIDTIRPVLDALAADPACDFEVTGPYAADGFFGQRGWTRCDGILAMYHDQGLAPFKALAMGGGVNVTAGLPIVRTSPDHGTGFDIAGRGVARAGSMLEAARLAAAIAVRRAEGIGDRG
ncbi:MAG: 4-hydroxythreonine-4-phosphate dehydrogenase PdxA [Bacteroidota bacterium]